MTPRTGSVTDFGETARCALVSALGRRGLAPQEGTASDSVTVEFGYRMITVRLTDDGWVRVVSGQPGAPAIVARQGNEEGLARQLARELLDRLP